MEKWNGSSITEFVLLGLTADPNLQTAFFVLFLVMYTITLIGNTMLITACITEPKLHTPMYFFLVNLSFLDVCYSSAIAPNMLVQFFLVRKTMSFSSCAAQMYFYLFLGITEGVLLAVMAYDRYVAISLPLRYNVIMSKSVCIKLLVFCWFSGCVGGLLDTVFPLTLSFCGNNVIDHFFCEGTAILKLSCVDTFITEMVMLSVGTYDLLIPSLLILISYICIINAILKIRSSGGRYKAFSTCASHLIVVTMYYSTCIYMYMKPTSKKSANLDKIVSVFYTVTPPMLNPIIYSLRNNDVKMALLQVTRRRIF
ncbi:olfactory receptor 5AR1-like [Lissotriton helveticus]